MGLPNLSTVVFASVAVLLSGRNVDGQTEGQDPRHRNDCRLAAKVLETGHPAPHYRWALEFVARCEETGAPALAAVWLRPPSAGDDLNRLFSASYTLRDARVTAAVLQAAANRSLPRLVRLNAIRVLAGHAVPEFLLSISDLLRSDSNTVRYYFPSVDHVSVRNGQSPVGESTIRTILESLEDLQSDPDSQVAQAASRTRRQLCLRLGQQVSR